MTPFRIRADTAGHDWIAAVDLHAFISLRLRWRIVGGKSHDRQAIVGYQVG